MSVDPIFWLLAAIGFLVVSVMLMLSIPGSFLPPEDAGRITLSVELPPNASLERPARRQTPFTSAFTILMAWKPSSCSAAHRPRAIWNCAAPP